MKTLLTLGLFFAAVSVSSAQTETKKEAIPSLSVCEALSHRTDYEGKIVRIHGRVVNTMEGAWFFSDECPGIIRTGDNVWPSTIWQNVLPNPKFRHHPTDFSFDWESSKRVNQRYGDLIHQGVRPDCIEFIYTGMFESYADFSHAIIVHDNGHLSYLGFGHLGGAPAQLVLKSADDAAEIPGCPRKK